MMPRPWWMIALVLTTAATGCLQADNPDAPESSPGFALVTIDGEIIEDGPQRSPYACGRPLWTAGLAIEEPQGLTLREDRMPADGITLAVWDTVEEVYAGNWTACEWPLLTLTSGPEQAWTLQNGAYNRTFHLERSETTLRIDNTPLTPGETLTIQLEHEANETEYSYHGQLRFTFHGLWGQEKATLVETEDEVRGWHGVVKPR